MRQLGSLLLLLGIGSCVVHFMNMEMRLLRWIDAWGEGPAWGIRGGFIVLGLILLATGKPKKDK